MGNRGSFRFAMSCREAGKRKGGRWVEGVGSVDEGGVSGWRRVCVQLAEGRIFSCLL